MELYEYRTIAQRLAKQYWGLDFNIPVVSNGRLGRSLGRYVYVRDRDTNEVKPRRIELAGRLFGNYKEETIVDTLKHELTHWAFSIQGKPFSDGHPVFENELRRVGAHSTHTVEMSGEIHQMVCSKCGKVVVESNSPGRLNRYRTGKNAHRYYTNCCRAALKYNGYVIREDKTAISSVTVKEAQELTSNTKIPEKYVATQTATIVEFKSGLKMEDILIPGPRGVTNKQMIPAMMKAIELQEKEIFLQLKATYPAVFDSSKKYLNKVYIPTMTQWLG